MDYGWGNAYRSSAFAGTHKLPDQIFKQGADRYDDSVKGGEIHEHKSKIKDQRIAGDTWNGSVCWRGNMLYGRTSASRTYLWTRCSVSHLRGRRRRHDKGETVSRRGENGKQKTFYGAVSAEFDAEYSP